MQLLFSAAKIQYFSPLNYSMPKELDNWFASWFDTPYYHTLYKDRDYAEAGEFMTNLTSFLNLKNGAQILDLACGKGRHSIFLNKIGYSVTGVDLSAKSIAHAKRYEKEGLNFQIHDMSLPYHKKFDAVFNLFTSFGYFEEPADNLRTIKAIKANLKPNGVGVIDFMNVDRVIKNMVPQESKTVDGITFNITRRYQAGYIVKDISFTDDKAYTFTEKVKAFTLEHFLHYFEHANVTLLHSFGDYRLNPFHVDTSERLILIFK